VECPDTVRCAVHSRCHRRGINLRPSGISRDHHPLEVKSAGCSDAAATFSRFEERSTPAEIDGRTCALSVSCGACAQTTSASSDRHVGQETGIPTPDNGSASRRRSAEKNCRIISRASDFVTFADKISAEESSILHGLPQRPPCSVPYRLYMR